MNRFQFAIVAISTFLPLLPRTLVAADRPNIVFFLADDQRNTSLGCAGHDIIQTPNIDGLAERGVRFENSFVSHSICWVSRTTILTGLTARSFGRPEAPDSAKPEALSSLYPDLLRSAGYRTGFFGKWHAKMPKGFKPEQHYDEYERITRNPYFHKQPDGSLRHETQMIGDRAVEFLDEQPTDKPFCLNLWFNASHAEDRDKRPGAGHFPWPKVTDGMYEDLSMPAPRLSDAKFFDVQPDFLKKSINRERFFWRWDTPEKYETNMRAYFRMISGIDHVVGRVTQKLKERGLDQNTIILYSADNGYFMGDRGFAGKWSHYEQSLRVPLIIADPRMPEAKRGQTVEQMALNLDFPSTFLDWAEVKIPSTYQGRSLKGIGLGEAPKKWRDDFFCEHVTLAPHITWEGVRNERYVYARYLDQKPVHEFLHDLKSDPDQLQNFVTNPDYSETLDKLRRRCNDMVAHYGGRLPALEPDGPRKGRRSDFVETPQTAAALKKKAHPTGDKQPANKAVQAKAARPAAKPRNAKNRLAFLTTGRKPQWIWGTRNADSAHFRKSFALPVGRIRAAKVYATCDNVVRLRVNGQAIPESSNWQSPVVVDDARTMFRTGENLITAECRNQGGPAGFVCKLLVTYDGGQKVQIVTDHSWKTSSASVSGWTSSSYDDSSWKPAKRLGALGMSPWGVPGSSGRESTAAKAQQTLAASEVGVQPGFKVERLYNVPKDSEGSWVSLTTDNKGRLIASDQGKQGLFRISVEDSGGNTNVTVEKIPVDISGAQGMVWAFDSLYAHVNGKHLYRIRDTNEDDILDNVEELPGATGGGEHGNHAVILTEDGRQLYVQSGNATNLPELTGSRNPTWDEDLLLPRQWDARGHARGRMAPGGWVSRFDPDAKTFELFCSGFRNAYDISLNRFGDMFTFDADMEWDMGMPWYRPTRICHVVSGGEYGWRSGTGKWPPYYEDSLPPVVNIGPGSPTGVVMGVGAKFPARFQDALFALDWTFGTIYVVHLEQQGAGYVGRREPFVWGSPLPVTDAIFGDDGALYFTVGGRGTQSGLYRVTYVGGESTSPASADDPEAAKARQLRRSLEAFHGRVNSAAVSTAWKHLGSPDRFIRYAARIAIESQPVEQWAERVVTETDSQARISGAVALARRGSEHHKSGNIVALLDLNPHQLPESQFLGLLRAYALTFIRLGAPTDAERKQIIAQLDPHFPNDSVNLNSELARVLIHLNASGVASKTMDLIRNAARPQLPDWAEAIQRNTRYGSTIQRMVENHPPSREILFALMLRNLRHGWTLAERRAYFEFLNDAAKASGGASYAGFLTNIRSEALANCSNAERLAIADITGEDFNPVPDFPVQPIAGPGKRWTFDELLPLTERRALGKASFEAGRSLFFAADCGKCHRFAGLGGGVGPDITTVRNKFDSAYMLEALLEPSKVVSDQYAASVVLINNGKSHTGLVVEDGETLAIYPSDTSVPPVEVSKSDVEEVLRSPTSQMPEGLLNRLNRNEIRDLLAYLLSGGNPEDRIYRK